MKLDLGILVGAESKVWLSDLTKLITRMEKLAEKQGVATADDSDDAEEAEVDDEDFGPKKKAGKKKAAFEEEEEEETEEESDDSEEEEELVAPKKLGKAAKAKKLTTDDLNDACKARVARLTDIKNPNRMTGKMARDNVLKLLKKNFETDTVSDIDDQDDMARAIKLLGGK